MNGSVKPLKNVGGNGSDAERNSAKIRGVTLRNCARAYRLVSNIRGLTCMP